MRQVIQSTRTGELRVVDVPEPVVQPGYALVRTTASLISAGTERMVVEFAKKSLVGKAQARPDLVQKVLQKARRDGIAATLRSVRSRLDEPLPLGYSAAGVITALGQGLEADFRVGQRVAMAGAGIANHAELNLVPANLLVPVPDGVSDEAAAFTTLAAIALHGIRNLGPALGDTVAVIGAGLIGLLALQLLAASGVRVAVLDPDPSRRERARAFGAELVVDPHDGAAERATRSMTAGRGIDGVLITAADESNLPLSLAAAIARDRARISIIGKVGTEFPFADYMKKELTLVVSRSYGPGRYDDEFELGGIKYPIGFVRWTETENLAECLRQMSPHVRQPIDVLGLISHRFPIEAADAAYRLVLERTEPFLGVLLRYDTAAPAKVPAPLPVTRIRPKGSCSLGVIGAGSFARTVLLPLLKEAGDIERHTVVTTRGATADHVRRQFGFSHASTDPQSVLASSAINAVLVATPHSTHADLVTAALSAGKPVFVEKPLALDRMELRRVVDARRGSQAFFTVGFNRRFAPMAVQVSRYLLDLPGPKMIAMRINSGPPPEHSQAGGRIMGELCHFVDLARFFARSPIRSVHAVAAQGGTAAMDDVAATLAFADGSVATIVYTGMGDSADLKERIEIFAAGTVLRIEDFRKLVVVADGRSSIKQSRFGQDKGHRAELSAFFSAVRSGGPAPIDESELLESSLATIALVESLRSGSPVTLATPPA